MTRSPDKRWCDTHGCLTQEACGRAGSCLEGGGHIRTPSAIEGHEDLEQMRYAADCPVSGTPEDYMAFLKALEDAYRSGRLVESAPSHERAHDEDGYLREDLAAVAERLYERLHAEIAKRGINLPGCDTTDRVLEVLARWAEDALRNAPRANEQACPKGKTCEWTQGGCLHRLRGMCDTVKTPPRWTTGWPDWHGIHGNVEVVPAEDYDMLHTMIVEANERDAEEVRGTPSSTAFTDEEIYAACRKHFGRIVSAGEVETFGAGFKAAATRSAIKEQKSERLAPNERIARELQEDGTSTPACVFRHGCLQKKHCIREQRCCGLDSEERGARSESTAK